MRKIVAIEHRALDGVMQAPARPDEDRRDGFEHGGWTARGNHPMMQAMVDEFLLMIHPIVLGAGRRLFPDASPFTKLALHESSTTPTGVVIASFSPSVD